MSKSIAVFASGTGSNFQALVEAFAQPDSGVVIKALVCDHALAPVVGKAALAGVPIITVDYREFVDKAAAEAAIVSQLPEVDLIVLAGYMRILGPTLLAAYPQRIINLHPACCLVFPDGRVLRMRGVMACRLPASRCTLWTRGLIRGKLLPRRRCVLNRV